MQVSLRPSRARGYRIAICYSWDVLPRVVQVLNGLPQDKQKLFQQTIQPAVQQGLVGELARLKLLAEYS